jgi:hypothetical protein
MWSGGTSALDEVSFARFEAYNGILQIIKNVSSS